MTMTRKLWSISALSVELGKDRRTIAARLRDVPPDGHERKQARWYMSTALETIYGPKRSTPRFEPAKPPKGAACLVKLPRSSKGAVQGGMMAAFLLAIYDQRGCVAQGIALAGGSAELAKDAANYSMMHLICAAELQLIESGVPKKLLDDGWLEKDFIDGNEPDWSKLETWGSTQRAQIEVG